MNKETEILIAAITKAARMAFQKLFSNGEHFYYCALLTTGEGFAPIISAWSWEALGRVIQSNSETYAQSIKWSYADSPYYAFGYDEYFSDVKQIFEHRANIDSLNDEEWGKEQMKRHFNKPSKYLLDLQTKQRRRMEAHRFEEAMQMQGEIAARHDRESQIAGRKMYKAYLQAVKRVEDKYNGYLQNIEGVFQRRKSDLDRRKEIALKPYNNRVAKLDLPNFVPTSHRGGRRPIVRTSTPGGQRPPERRGNIA